MVKWHQHFLKMAYENAKMSKDPSTKVGAILVRDKLILSAGFNGLPRGLEDTEERLTNRGLKLQLVVHAETNAVLAAARNGINTNGSTLYLCATDQSGDIWGGPPCIRCLVEVIQAGIVEIVTYKRKSVPSKWSSSLDLSAEVIKEIGINYLEIDYVA